MSKFHEIFYICYLWPWLSLPLMSGIGGMFIDCFILLHCRQRKTEPRPHVTLYASGFLWMTSCIHVVGLVGQNQRQRICFVEFSRWQTGGEVGVYDCRLVPLAGIVVQCLMQSFYLPSESVLLCQSPNSLLPVITVLRALHFYRLLCSM